MISKCVRLPLFFLLGIGFVFIAFQPQTKAQSEFVSVKANVLNIREGPGLSYKVIIQVKKGTILTVKETINYWHYVRLANGQTGWVFKDYVVSVPGSLSFLPAEQNVEALFLTQREALSDYRPSSLGGKKIILDPGHGGRDKGATSLSGLNEKDLALMTAKLLEKRLSALGAHVILTRSADQYVSLEQRVYIANKGHADAFISIHYNSSENKQVHGLITYYNKTKHLADNLHQELIDFTSFNNKKVRYGNYYVLRENLRPAVLLELGFISHPDEESEVQTEEFQANAVSAVVKGLTQYFDNR